MSIARESVVSIHPYFKVHAGKMDEFKALLGELVAQTSKEETCLYYDFSIMDEELVFCREAYVGAAGMLAHLENVSEIVPRALEISDMIRVEVHGGEEELEQLKEPMKDLNADWFVFECGVGPIRGVC